MSYIKHKAMSAIDKTRAPRGKPYGMPSWVDSGMTKDADGMKGGKGAGPKREGPIGRKGPTGPFPKKAPGTMGPNSAWDGSRKNKRAPVQVSGAREYGSGKPKADGRMEKLRGKT